MEFTFDQILEEIDVLRNFKEVSNEFQSSIESVFQKAKNFESFWKEYKSKHQYCAVRIKARDLKIEKLEQEIELLREELLNLVLKCLYFL